MPQFKDQSFAAFLFDMDGTLLDSSPVVERVWRTWARRQGVDAETLLAASHGVRSEDTIRRFATATTDIARETDWILQAELNDIEGVVALAGVAALIDRLEPHEWAIVTSASRDLARVRLRAASLPLPRVLVTAEDVARGKPDPQGFLKAATLLGAPIADCLVFEDSPAGVAAAKAAGAHVAIVGGRVPPDEGRFAIADYL